MDNFKSELSRLLNKYSKDNDANTPDYILAEMLNSMLNAYIDASHWKKKHEES